LKSIQERVERLGGTLSITSRINQGCRVTISLQPSARSRGSELGQRPRSRRVAEVR
jgi:nitrate/nitrite-specific signal transduction histidine kinase